jgi:hypothetical protein
MEPGAETRAVALGWPYRWLPRFETAQLLAWAEVWRAFWLTRALIWLVGIAAVLVLGTHDSPRLDGLWLTAPFDSDLANLIVSPAARFDASWYLEIARFGYQLPDQAAFFPLYPGLMALISPFTGSPLVGGIVISSACSLAGMYLLYRLTELDFGWRAARTAIWIVACFPVAFCLSAVYTEGLFLLLSVGAVYAARLGRWPSAAVCAALAATTRSAGILLIAPLAVLYLYGPRADRAPDRHAAGRRPRYRLRPDAALLLAAPAGLLAYMGYLAVALGNPLAAFNAQAGWERIFAPFAGIALGAWEAISGLADLAPSLADGTLWNVHADPAGRLAMLNLVLFGFLALGCWLTIEAGRRLPLGYLTYAITSLALPLSVPAAGEPLMSLPRFLLVAFPLWIALALWTLERRRALRGVLAGSIALLVLGTTLFAGWATAP